MNLPGDLVFAWPWWLLALPAPLLYRLFLSAYQTRPGRALKVVDLSRFDQLTDTGRRGTWLTLPLLAGLSVWVLLVVAGTRPQWLGDPLDAATSGRDLMLCIDISGSMRESDMLTGNSTATRMQVVRQVGREFIARREGDRIGLIMFGAQAYVQTPLTFDHQSVQYFLGEADVGLAGRATAIGDAIGLGVKRLREREGDSRVLILLTDGANSAGVDPLEAADIAADSGIRIYTIGVGSDPRAGLGGLLFGGGRSELDEASLQAIARQTGGQYFRARDAAELNRIYAEIDRLEPLEHEDKPLRPLKELFPWPLGAALLLSTLLVARMRRVLLC